VAPASVAVTAVLIVAGGIDGPFPRGRQRKPIRHDIE
jgi:hypothetical protein